jgi:hypothetical protein
MAAEVGREHKLTCRSSVLDVQKIDSRVSVRISPDLWATPCPLGAPPESGGEFGQPRIGIQA